MSRAGLVGLVGLGVVAVAACSSAPSLPDAASRPREVVMETKVLRPGELGEATLNGSAADRAVFRMRAGAAPFDFNVHGHAGSGTQTVHEELAVTEVAYAFVPPAQAEWFFLVRNAGAASITVTVEIDLYGAITWSGWQ